MGELLLSAYAKRLVNQHQVILRSKVLRMHQWGISLPGACEGLCHWRATIELLAANGTLEPLVAADLDLVNMFGNAYWRRIRQALRTHFPEASAWTEWQHKADSVTTLPTGATFATNWGAEQGDVLGTIQSALVLKQAREAHLVRSSPTPRASATNGLWMTGRCSLIPFSVTPSYEPWMLPLPPSVPPGVRCTRQRQELRAPALPSRAPARVPRVGQVVRARHR